MDGLRPEVDELDRFKNRSTPKVKSEVQRKSTARPESSMQKKSSSNFPVVIVFLLLVCAVTVFAWFSWKQQIELVSLKTQLSDASGFMDQSKLLIARLEGKLSETGVELAESGTAAEKKLAFLDAEMRKLWGVAYDRNKKAIEENQASLKGLSDKLSSVQKDQSARFKEITKEISGLSEELTKLVKRTEAYGVRLDTLVNEVSVVSTDINNRLVEQKKSIEGVRKDTQNYLERTAKFDLSIESINASRRQLNERIVDLDKKINALQLKNSASVN